MNCLPHTGHLTRPCRPISIPSRTPTNTLHGGTTLSPGDALVPEVRRPVTSELLRSGGVPDAGDRVSACGRTEDVFGGIYLGGVELMLRALSGFWSVLSGARAVGLDGVLALPLRQFVWAARLQGSSLRGRASAGRRLATGPDGTVAKQAGSVLARTIPSPNGSSTRGRPAPQGVPPRRRQACS